MEHYASLLTSKKYNSEEKKLLLVGIVQNLIYSRSVFPSNMSLSKYIHIFEEIYNLEKNELFKEYLYRSRTLLSSRVCRMIIENTDPKIDRKLIDWHSNFLNIIIRTEEAGRIKDNNKSLLSDYLFERSRHK
ncbi:hypothetical protein ACQGRJ_09725 [Bacillus atrophaeus]|uniref:hypothetical protein n=1 Tax=Bacillus atrophaeus TaxID=1452 RepID=UPI003CEF5B07